MSLLGRKREGRRVEERAQEHTPVRLLVITRRHFSVLLKDVPGLTEALLVTLSRRVG